MATFCAGVSPPVASRRMNAILPAASIAANSAVEPFPALTTAASSRPFRKSELVKYAGFSASGVGLRIWPVMVGAPQLTVIPETSLPERTRAP